MRKPVIKITGNILSLTIDSEISSSACDFICRELEKCVAAHGSARLFLNVRYYPAFNSAEEFYENLRFVKVYSDHIDRVAVMGDRAWHSTWVGLFGLFSGVEMAFFDTSEITAAFQWLQDA